MAIIPWTMKKYLITILACLAFMCSCNKVEPEEVEPQIPVTFTNTSGDWVLSTWKNNDMSATPIYLRLKDKKFVLWQSVGSMYPVKYTGEYNLIEEDGFDTMIRGIYDYTYEFWSHNYFITSLTAKEMEWTSSDDPDDISVYIRTDSFPEE